MVRQARWRSLSDRESTITIIEITFTIDRVSSIPNGKLHWHQGKRSPIVREVYEELGIEIIDRPRYCEVDRKKAEVQASTESKKRVN
jgi:8-oxo-dGTP pyrophosphatase MutT (NUDIX family)